MGKNGTGEILERIRGANPDVIVLEEVADEDVEALRLGLPGYAFRHLDQFVIASRFPIEEAVVPARNLERWRRHNRPRTRAAG